MLMTDCLQAVVAVVASRWRYIWPRRGGYWSWCASSSLSHGHRYRQPAAGSDTCLSTGRVWCRTSPADKRCTPVQQYTKLQNIHLYNSATNVRDRAMLDVHLYKKLSGSHARCTPVRQVFRLSHVICTPVKPAFGLSHARCSHVQPALRLSHVRYTHVQQAFRLRHARCTPVQQRNKLSEMVMLQMYTCTTHFQTESCSRCTPVQ